MANTGAVYAGSGVNITGLGTIAWSNPGNITSDNNVSATAAFGSGSGASTNWLVATGFDFTSIPDGSTIDGIVVEMGISANFGGRCSDTDVYLTKDGTSTVGVDKATATNVTTSEVNRTYGGATDTWSASPTASEVKSSTFGVMIRLLQGIGTATASVDYVRITVYYTPPSVNYLAGAFFAFF